MPLLWLSMVRMIQSVEDRDVSLACDAQLELGLHPEIKLQPEAPVRCLAPCLVF